MTKQLLIEKLSLVSASNQALEIANDLEKDQDLISARDRIKKASTFWEKRLGDKYSSIQLFKNCKAISKILLVIRLHAVAKELAEESTKIEIIGDFTIYPNSWVNNNDLMYRYGSDVMAMRKRDSRGDIWQDSTVSNKDLDQFIKYGVIFPCHWQIVENSTTVITNAYGWKIEALQKAGSELIPEDARNGIAQIWGCPNLKKVQDNLGRILSGLQVDVQPNCFSIVDPNNGEVYFFDVIKAEESVTIADSDGWIPEDPTNEDLEYIMGNSGEPEGEEISCNPDIAQLLLEGFNDLAELIKYSLSGMQSMSELIYTEYMKKALNQFNGGVVAEHHIYFTWLLLTDMDTKEDAIEAIHTGAITFQTIVEKYLNGEI